MSWHARKIPRGLQIKPTTFFPGIFGRFPECCAISTWREYKILFLNIENTILRAQFVCPCNMHFEKKRDENNGDFESTGPQCLKHSNDNRLSQRESNLMMVGRSTHSLAHWKTYTSIFYSYIYMAKTLGEAVFGGICAAWLLGSPFLGIPRPFPNVMRQELDPTNPGCMVHFSRTPTLRTAPEAHWRLEMQMQKIGVSNK